MQYLIKYYFVVAKRQDHIFNIASMNHLLPLISETVQLRSITEKDLPNIFKGLSHPDIIKHYGVHYDTLEATQGQMKWYADIEQGKPGKWFAICATDNLQFMGAIGLNYIIHQHRKGEIGFWLLKEFWGKGIIPQAIDLVCNYGFQQLGLHRIEAMVESENLNSKKVLTRAHFTHEGTMKECEIKNGRFISL